MADVAVPIADLVARTAVDLPFTNAANIDDVFTVDLSGAGGVFVQAWTSVGPANRFATIETTLRIDGLAVADRRVSLPGPTVSAPTWFDPAVYGPTLRIRPDIDSDQVRVRAFRFPNGA